ncbi:formylmethanofuran dehydrogenase subunit B [Singulisphaera sp. PoT]|uniref:formylmethanofuran dehydrogenase subunit B n=1 Tax=Singulisphaera sp. PoT TaxID=3411797 RepID=UPI003BF48A27
MSNPPQSGLALASDAGPVKRVSDVTCLQCGCLCDDLTVSVEAGKVREVENACATGRAWFLADRSRDDVPVATVDGTPASSEAALDRVAEILRTSRAPLILGLSQVSNEAVASALALADRVGAVVDSSWSPEPEQYVRAVQRVGRVSSTLGEVKNRADLVLFWGVDPVVTHSRHWSRYSVEPKGRFVPEGRAGRHVIVVDDHRTKTAERADDFLSLPPQTWFETLWVLRGLLRGLKLDPARVESTTGLSLETLQALAERLKRAKYGAMFVDSRLVREGGGSAASEAALSLVRDLNSFTRFVILDLGSRGNPAGASAVQTWQTGFATSLSLAGGSPESLPGATSAPVLLEREAFDAVVILGEPPSEALLAKLRVAGGSPLKTVMIGPRATTAMPDATVSLDAATYGIGAGGSVTRVDGVSLPLRASIDEGRPTVSHWLAEIEGRLAT